MFAIICRALAVLLLAALAAGQPYLPCTLVVPVVDYAAGACVFSMNGLIADTDVECRRVEQLFAEATGIYGADLYIHKPGYCGIAVRLPRRPRSRCRLRLEPKHRLSRAFAGGHELYQGQYCLCISPMQ